MKTKITTANRIKRIAMFALPVFALSSLGVAEERETEDESFPEDALIIDVRTPEEFQSGHFPGAKNIPLSTIPGRISEFGLKDQVIVVYCRSGRRSGIAERFLKQAGYLKTVNGGGLDEMLRRLK